MISDSQASTKPRVSTAVIYECAGQPSADLGSDGDGAWDGDLKYFWLKYKGEWQAPMNLKRNYANLFIDDADKEP